MQKRIISHLTWNGTPVCKLPLSFLNNRGLSGKCEFRSLYQARKEASNAKDWRAKAVKGRCPAFHKE